MKRHIHFIQLLWLTAIDCDVFADDIRDIKPPVYFTANYTFVFYLLAIAVMVLVLFFIIMFYRKHRVRPEAGQESFFCSPHEKAYEALERLDARNLPAQDLVKEYYSELSGIVRCYLEDRFGWRAPEMTTEEFLEALRSSDYLNGSQKNLLKSFLTHCDLVKFAKYGPSQTEIAESFRAARRLVDETKPQPLPQTEIKQKP